MEKRVLIVDDEVAITEGLRLLFECEQLESAAANDRASAVALFDGAYYPVVVADLCLHTQEEGLALIDHVLQTNPRSKVLVLSAFATPPVQAELVERGVSRVLQKPASGGEILEAIQALLGELERDAAAAGEPVDLERLYEQARGRLYSLARSRFRLSHDRAEDVLQEAWLLFLQKREAVRAVNPWLAGVVANLARQHLDQAARRRETTADDVPPEALAVPCALDDAERLSLERALERIDERQRTLCRLIAIDGLSYAEVSDATGLPLGSIGPTYLRAKRRLKELLSH